MPISNERNYILKPDVAHSGVVALTQAAANAATGDYSVADLVQLINTAITTKYNNVSQAEVLGKPTGTIGLATSKQY